MNAKWPLVHKVLVTALVSAAVLAPLSCAHKTKKPNEGIRDIGSSLSQEAASKRAKQIADVDYELFFDLSASGETYSGKSTVLFKALVSQQNVRVDFSGGDVRSVVIDGKTLTPEQFAYNKDTLQIPASFVTVGPHKLEIEFTHRYSREGRGLSRFVDPVDKRVYVSSQFETYYANQTFPCFDQPDLKASYRLKVVAPKDWEIISAARETSIHNGGDTRTWTFPQTARFSTYIFSLHGGPFAKWEDTSFRIPLRLFARQSLAPHVKPQEWFPITRHGFEFFEKYFSTAYPYKKYDQILVPEFTAGAMENVGAVTFTEHFVARGAKTRAQLRGLANTILHEMAHMWFGNLVTMKWWGDLWLNETFATYMASVGAAASHKHPETWRAFYAGRAGAFHEDQLATTHPIVAKVENTDQAFTSFDSITYGKGAAVLKQLSYFIGEDKFKAGLKLYFSRFAGKNTEYADFMSAMSEAAGRDLSSWRKQWFETAGLNTIAASFDCASGKVTKLSLKQSVASGDKVLRTHATQVALLRERKAGLEAAETYKVEITGEETLIPQAVGRSCPAGVYPNYKDYGHFKVRLDDRTTHTLQKPGVISNVTERMLRQQVWFALWDKVRDAELSLLSFAATLPKAMKAERDEIVLRQIFYYVSGTYDYIQQSPKLRGSTQAQKFAEEVEQVAWERLIHSTARSSDQLIWFNGIQAASLTPWGLSQIKKVLRSPLQIAGFDLDQDRRWELINVLARREDEEARTFITAEATKDKSSRGIERKIASEAALPSWEGKMHWVNEYKKTPSHHSFSQLRSAFGNLFPSTQNEFRNRYSKQFFNDILWANQNRENFAVGILTYLAPSECSDKAAGQIDDFLKKNSDLLPVLNKNMKNISEEGARCRKIVKLAEAGARAYLP